MALPRAEDAPPRKGAGNPGRRLKGALAHYLGTAIVSGRIAPGERLTGEVEHAEALAVSRSAYREAVQVLAAKGLIESRPKLGTTVLPRDRWNLLDPTVLAWAFESEPDEELVRALFELRTIIEPAAARLAAQRRDGADIASLAAALDAMGRHTLETEAGRAGDRAFHAALLAATRNQVVASLSASIEAAVSWTTVFKQRQHALPRDPVADHAAVFDAVRDGDGDAAAARMATLVANALADTRHALDELRARSGR